MHVHEIKYVARLIRGRLANPKSTGTSTYTDHDKSINKSFWGYVKRTMQNKPSLLPSFSLDSCNKYFLSLVSAKAPNRSFPMPSWIPSSAAPVHPFNLQPPSYQKITSVIQRMKASSSPSPLDRNSIICFKHCPYLRSVLLELIKNILSSGCIPSEWKKACIILIHKKGETNDPANFRPITLQSVGLKIFASCLRDSIFDFLKINGYDENESQKGFTHKVSGTLEHTAMMGNIINKTRIKQRSLVITLLDLKNAVGEVHHNLISSVRTYHYIPENIKSLISGLYTNFKTSIITDHYRSPAILVCRGLLQGDCLSPLLFNMCFNTFIQFIREI